MLKTVRGLAAGLVVCALAVGTAAWAQVPVNKADTGPRLDFPAGLATDGTAVYVSNSRNHTLDKIDLASHSLSLLAGKLFKAGIADGTGAAAELSSPSGLAIVGDALYLVDTNNSTLRKIALPAGTVSTIAGTPNLPGTDDGKGSVAHFNLPTQIAADPNGSRLFVTDSGSSSIRMISVPDYVVKTIGGQVGEGGEGKEDGPPSKSKFNRPRGCATDGKFLYISDTGNNLIRKIDLSSMTSSTVAGTGEEG